MIEGRGPLPRWVYAPALIGLAVVVVPLLALLPRVEWGNFFSDISEPATLDALILSTKSAALAVLACVILGVPLALLIARAPATLGVVLRTIVTLPLVLPPLVGGVALLAVLGRTGLVGPWLEGLGVSVPFTPIAVVVAQTFVAMPFLVISVEGALRSAGTEYEQVAAGLGAGRARILARITLPLIMPGLLAGIVLAFARSVGEFGATALLAGNKPGVTQTIPMAIYTAFNGVGASRQAAMALSVLLIATALAVLLLFPVARGSSAGVIRSRTGAETDTDPAEAPTTSDAATLDPGAPGREDPAEAGHALHVDAGFTRPGFTFEARIDVDPGEVMAVVGPNAAGKSTLLNIVAGNLTPRRGEVALDGHTLSTPKAVIAPERREIGVLSQQPLLFPHMSVTENVAFGPRSRGVTKRDAHAHARELLTHVGLAGTSKRRPDQLSGGQQQRVALARALATEPRVLLLDEPLAALDVATAPHIRRILAREIARTRVTAMVVTHDLLDVVGLADTVAVIERGHVAETRPVAEFLKRPTSAFGAALTGVNALPHPGTGELVYLEAEDLEFTVLASRPESPRPELPHSESPRPEPAGTGWVGTVELVEIAGARGIIRASVGDRFITLPCDLADTRHVVPGGQVRISPASARVE